MNDGHNISLNLQRLINERELILAERLDNCHGNILEMYPFREIASDLKALPALMNYPDLGEACFSRLSELTGDYGTNTVNDYTQLIALKMAKQSLEHLKHGILPNGLEALYHQWMARIVKEFPMKIEGPCYKNDLFLKYLSVCSLRTIPVGGAWIAEISGISRRIMISGGIKQLLDASAFFGLVTKGTIPFYQIHMVQSMTDLVNPQSRQDCYRGVARLLTANTEVKGMFAGSWYYDPAIKQISPQMSYMCDSAVQNGARVFKVGSTRSDIDNATKTSKTRKRLYQTGKYLPTTYCLIWSRKDLIAWNKKTGKG